MFRNYKSAKPQRGFLIPLSLFIIVGLSILAIALSRLSAQTGSASFREAISVQAFYAAESGVQYTMNQLFYPAALRTTADANCLVINGATQNFTVTGLQDCSALISCSVSNDSSGSISFYSVSSTGRCGNGDIEGERIIKAAAYIDDNS